jgi:hypothetical protein
MGRPRQLRSISTKNKKPALGYPARESRSCAELYSSRENALRLSMGAPIGRARAQSRSCLSACRWAARPSAARAALGVGSLHMQKLER